MAYTYNIDGTFTPKVQNGQQVVAQGGQQVNQQQAQVEQPQQMSALEQAQKRYDDALARSNESTMANITSYQDILDRLGPAETREQAQERERKEKNKRDLLALISLGANIGNMVNATTGGHMGSRSVATPDLVTPYDKARNDELTFRMKRDEKRNAARQAMINLKGQDAKSQLALAGNQLLQAHKNEDAIRLQKHKAAAASALKAQKDAAANQRTAAQIRAANERAKFANDLGWARLNNQKDYQNKLLEVKNEANKLKAGNGSKDIITVSTIGGKGMYKIPKVILENDMTIGALKANLPKEYSDRITDLSTAKEASKIIGEYLRNKDATSKNPHHDDMLGLLESYETGTDKTVNSNEVDILDAIENSNEYYYKPNNFIENGSLVWY